MSPGKVSASVQLMDRFITDPGNHIKVPIRGISCSRWEYIMYIAFNIPPSI